MASLPTPRPVEPIPLNVGDIIRIDDRHDWTVQAVSEHFAAAVRPVTDADRDTDYREAEELAEEYSGTVDEFQQIGADDRTFYTVLDWRHGVRGPCNLIGQGYGDGEYTEAECAEMLAEFEAGELEISARNWVWLDVHVKSRV